MPTATTTPSPTATTTTRHERDDTPPPPHAPLASTPGPRASTLQTLFHDALSHTLRTCSYRNFAACFPTPARYVPEELDGFHRAFVNRLEGSCKTEFAGILEERGVVASLNELDALVAEARVRMEREREKEKGKEGPAVDAMGSDQGQNDKQVPVPPHLLPPPALLNAHLAPFLTAQHSELSTRLSETQVANRSLGEEIAGQRAEIERLVASLEGVVADLEGAAVALQGEQMEGIEQELVTGPGIGV